MKHIYVCRGDQGGVVEKVAFDTLADLVDYLRRHHGATQQPSSYETSAQAADRSGVADAARRGFSSGTSTSQEGGE